MTAQKLDRTLGLLALLASVIVGCMIAGFIATGSSQDVFQVARPLESQLALLTGNPLHAFGIRLNVGLDNLFLLVYSAFFVLLAVRLRGVLDPWILGVALGALLLTAFFDAAENHHIIVMLHSAERGIALGAWESQLQMILSNLKFHFNYLGALLFAFGFWRLAGLGRAIAVALWVYLPVGVLISVTPVELARPLILGRTAFFMAAFLMAAILFLRGAPPRPA